VTFVRIDYLSKDLIIEKVGNMVSLISSHDEISKSIFSLNEDRALGPDEFGALLF
jgi:hypothetical protein